MSTSSPEDTPANHSALLGNEQAKTTHDTCGPTSETPLASYDLDTHCWKMCGVISLWEESPLLQTLPPSGMTVNGALFRQPPWVPIIDATGSSLLHTPTAKMNQLAPSMNNGWWPTPTTQEVEHPDMELTSTGRRRTSTGGSHSVGLADAVRLWPTPTTRDYKDGTAPRIRDGKVQTDTLGRAVQLWPTPTYGKLAGGSGGMEQIERLYSDGTITSEERKAMRAGNGGKLNPTWVEWLMGFPLGWTDLEDLETL